MRLAILAFSLLIGFVAKAAEEVPQALTLDGRLYADASGKAPLLDTGSFKIQILDYNGTCVLYEELQGFDTRGTGGRFNINIGEKSSGTTKRTVQDSGNSLAAIFANDGSALPGKLLSNGAACSGSTIAGTDRSVLITVIANSDPTPRTMDPFPLTSVPSALIAERAESLQGIKATGFLQVRNVAPYALSQSNLENVFSTSNYSKLTDLLNGSSVQYLQSSSNGAIQTPVMSGTPTSPAAGQIWYESGTIKYWNGSSAQTLAAGTSALVSNNSSLANGKIWIGDAGGLAQERAISGDVSVTNAGVTAVTKLQGTTVSATAPTTAGQVLRYSGTQWLPNFVAMGDLRSNVTGTTALATSCAASQTLTYNSAMDNLTCSDIAISPTQITSAAGSLVLNGGQAGAVIAGTTDVNSLTLKTNNADRVTILSDGKVGIGTTVPTSMLDVTGVSTAGTSLRLRSGSVSTAPAPATQIAFSYNGTGNYTHNIRSRHNSGGPTGNALDFYLWDNSVDAAAGLGTRQVMTLEGRGNIGIGTSSPATALDIRGTSFGQVRMKNSGSQELWMGTVADTVGSYIGNNAYYYSSWQYTPTSTAASGISFRETGSTEFWSDTGLTAGVNYSPTKRMVITNTGNVGIGTTTPGATLDVNGSFRASSISGAYLAQNPWANGTSPNKSRNGLGMPMNRLLGATSGKFTVTTNNVTGTVANLFDGTYDSSTDIAAGAVGAIEVDFSPSVNWVPNVSGGYTYSDGLLAMTFYNTSYPTDITIEFYTTVAGVDQWDTAYTTTTNAKNPVVIDVSGKQYVKKLRVSYSNAGVAVKPTEVEWFVTRAGNNRDFSTIPSSGGNFDVGLASLNFKDTSWSTIASIANTGNAYFMGNVGVGTNNPSTKLHVNGVVTATGFSGPMSPSVMGAGAGSNTAPSISFSGDPDTGFYNTSSNNTISVGVGNAKIFDFSSLGLVSATAGGANITTANGVANAPTYSFSGDSDTGWWSPGANTMAASTGGFERMRILSSGYVGIGTTVPALNLDVVGDVGLNDKANSAWGPSLKMRKERAGAIVQNGDELGYIDFQGYDGSASNRAAMIIAKVDGTPAAGQVPGSLGLYTRAVGAGTATERMRISNAGNVGIGTSTPTATLDVNGTLKVKVHNGGSGIAANSILFYVDPVNGSDTTGDGSVATPFQSITKALQVFGTMPTSALSIFVTNSSDTNPAVMGQVELPGKVIQFSGDAGTQIDVNGPILGALEVYLHNNQASGGPTYRIKSTAGVVRGVKKLVLGGHYATTFRYDVDNAAVVASVYTSRQRAGGADIYFGRTTLVHNTGIVGGRLVLNYSNDAYFQVNAHSGLGQNVFNDIDVNSNVNWVWNTVKTDANGNVGIGTETPAAKLDVDGVIRGDTHANGYGRYFANLSVHQGGSGSNRYLLLARKISTDSIAGVFYGRRNHTSTSGENAAMIRVMIRTDGTPTDSAVFAETIGNVSGMGLVELTYAGEVWYAFDAVLSSTNAPLNFATFTGRYTAQTNQLTWITSADASGITTVSNTDYYNMGNRFYVGATGVGIGTSAPQNELHVHDAGGSTADIRVTQSGSGAASTDGLLLRSTGSDANINNLETGFLSFATNGGERVRIAATGDVGIGTTNPAAKLDVNGTIRGNGITDLSDARLKKDVRDLAGSLDKISRVQGVSYFWKNPARGQGEQIGFIAQQVEKVYPELVETDSTGLKSVNYSHFVAPLIEAIKELKDRLFGVDERVTRLEKENEQMKKVLCELKPESSFCADGSNSPGSP